MGTYTTAKVVVAIVVVALEVVKVAVVEYYIQKVGMFNLKS